jgi:hypothetical protein
LGILDEFAYIFGGCQDVCSELFPLRLLNPKMVEYIKTANNASSYPTKTVVANPIPIIAVDSTILFA